MYKASSYYAHQQKGSQSVTLTPMAYHSLVKAAHTEYNNWLQSELGPLAYTLACLHGSLLKSFLDEKVHPYTRWNNIIFLFNNKIGRISPIHQIQRLSHQLKLLAGMWETGLYRLTTVGGIKQIVTLEYIYLNF